MGARFFTEARQFSVVGKPSGRCPPLSLYLLKIFLVQKWVSSESIETKNKVLNSAPIDPSDFYNLQIEKGLESKNMP